VKIDIPLLATLLLIGTILLARAQAHGIEQALFATAIEYGVGGLKAGARFLGLSR
jgi:hypothetical protein